ncbi:MAG TPA: PAS domain-containing protein [Burkholderiaceae bacterium]|nr:PAS domain-containing protein [Burkholderiaceae bacterium]
MSFRASLLLLPLLVLGLWERLPRGDLLTWMFAVWATQAGHEVYSRAYRKHRKPEVADHRRWLCGFWVGAVVVGACWSLPFLRMDALSHDAVFLLVCAIAGVTAYGGVERSSALSVALVFEFATLLPVTTWLFLQGSDIHRTMGMASLLYLVLLVPLLRRMNQMVTRTLALNDENHRLNRAQQASLEQLSRSEEEYRTLVTNLPVAVIRCDAERRYRYINPLAEQVLRQHFSTECLQTPQAMPERYNHAMAEVMATGKVVEFELTEEVSPDHRPVHFQVRIAPECDGEGKVTGTLTTWFDMTEHRRMEDDLQMKKQVLDHAHDSIYLIDEQGRFVYVNDEACRALGYTRDELLCMGVPDIDQAYSVEDTNAVGLQAQKDGSFAFETQHRRRNGSLFPVEIRASALVHRGRQLGLAVARDISERKAIEQALRHSEGMLNEAQRIAHVGSWDVDMVNDKLTWSDELFRIWEIDKTSFKADFAAFLDTVHPDDRARVQQAYDDAVLKHELYEVEHRLLFPDGRIKHILERGEPQYDAQGKPVRFIGTSQDITERKRLEDALTEREREFRSLAENTPDNIVRWDTAGRYLYVNPTHQRLLGRTLDELVGQFIPESHEQVRAALQQVVSTGQAVCAVRQTAMNQGVKQLHDVSLVPEFDASGKVVSVLGMGRDMTSVYHLQEAIGNERATLRAFFEALPALAWMKDSDGRYLACNPAFEQLFGTTEATILGKTDFDFVDAELATFFRQKDMEAEAAGQPCVNEEWVTFASNGRRALMETVKTPVLSADGKTIGIIGVANDITERKRAEQALQERGDLLNAIVNSSPDIIVFALDRDYRYIAFNVRHRQVMKAIWGKDIAVGKSMLELIGDHPDRETARQGFDRALAGESFVDESAYGHEAISREYWQTFWSPIRTPAGEVTGLTCFVLNVSERRRAEESLRRSEQLMRTVIDATPDWIFVKDREHRYHLANKGYADALHITPNDILGKDDLELGFPEALVKGDPAQGIRGFWADDRLVMERNEPLVFSDDPATINGEIHTFHTIKVPLCDDEGTPWGVLAFARDITERKQAETLLQQRYEHIVELHARLEQDARLLEEQAGKLAKREQEFRTLVENSVDTVARYGRDLRRLYVNPAFAALVEGGAAALLGRTPSECPGGPHAATYERKLTEVFVGGKGTTFELQWQDGNGQEMCSLINLTPEYDAQGQVVSVLSVGRDISELNAFRHKIHQMAFYDPLTELPNRALFNDRLRQMINDAGWHGQQAGLMMMDMDRFKAVNDTLGHSAGDELLRETAARLSTCVRTYDTVARLGGDEFAFLLPEIRSGEDLGRVAANVLAVLQKPFVLAGKEVFVSCSIGIALYPNDSTVADDLLKFADSAMYFAKRSGRNSFRFYSRDLTASSHERLELESDLRRAVERNELELFYQPKVSLNDGTLLGSEALLRWNHPQRGMIPPNTFIGIAEDSGLIVDIGEWVLWDACRTARQWNGDGKPLHQVAINLSARQFQGSDLVETVSRALRENDCQAAWIELEITESLLLDDERGVLDTLNSLTAMGISIAIDDFGTGYSALSYLARFPIGTLKIDRSFISHVTTDKYRAELVKAILSIAHCLGQQVVAEGVETQDQADFLRAHGCPVAQGYLYGKPMPVAAFEALTTG